MLDAQRSFAAHGIKGECGHVTIPVGSASVEVPVNVKTVFMGLGMAKSHKTDEAVICSCNNKVIDSKVIFKREGPHLNDKATLNYLIFGW